MYSKESTASMRTNSNDWNTAQNFIDCQSHHVWSRYLFFIFIQNKILNMRLISQFFLFNHSIKRG